MRKRNMLILSGFWGLFVGAVPVLAFQLPDTGITKCYDNEKEITCPAPDEPFYGQDAQYSGPQLSYHDNGDGTVTDLNTGLIWQKGDTQKASGRTWQEACDYCAALALGGYSDWRLPTRRELLSIVNFGRLFPCITTTYFPDCISGYYWSSSAVVSNPDEAWGSSFYQPWMQPLTKAYSDFYVRCVRGGPISAPAFRDNGNGTITDSTTGLVWQKGESWAQTWEEALDYCEGLTLGNRSDWRLPNIRELESIVDWDRSNPAINITYFPDCSGSIYTCYWSSSTRMSLLEQAHTVNFNLGNVRDDGKVMYEISRCVCGGPVEHYVEPSGVCGTKTPCYTTIQAALNAAADGDTVQAAKTLAAEEPVWSKTGTVTISGGWKTDFSGQDGTTSMYAPKATGGGGVKIQPNVKIIPKP